MLKSEDRPDLSLARFGRELSGSLLHWDSRLWSSLRELFFRPGHTARLAVSGEEVSARIHPVRLYLAANLVFFLLLPFLNDESFTLIRNDVEVLVGMTPSYAGVLEDEADRAQLDPSDYRLRLDAWIASHQGAFVAVLLPLLALLLWLFFGRRRRYFVEHLVFSTTYYTTFLLSFLMLGLVARVASSLFSAVTVVLWLPLPWLLWMGWWLWRGQQRFYGVGRWRSAFVVPVTYFGSLLAFIGYTQVLFWAGVVSLRFR